MPGMSLDGFVADRRDRRPHRAGLLGDGIRLYNATGGKPMHLSRDSDTSTQTVDLRYRPAG
jgi:hypothetical protein